MDLHLSVSNKKEHVVDVCSYGMNSFSYKVRNIFWFITEFLFCLKNKSFRQHT